MGKRKDYFETLCSLDFMEKREGKEPLSQFPLIETHCHLDYLKENNVDQVVSLAKKIGIEKIITISVSLSNLEEVIKLCDNENIIFGTQGIHPHEAKEWSQEAEKKIIAHIKKNKKIIAIGEIGLDYHYEFAPKSDQRNAFERQLQLACDLELPVVIHTREAEEDTKAILKNFSSSLKKKGVLHSFTSNLDLASFALNENFYLGFNGIVTFKKADDVRQSLDICPPEKILIETDAPYLTPSPHRGKENSPCYLPFIAQYISSFKKIPAEILLPQLYKNSLNLFKLEP
jgi:TatD DNase family protein